MKMKRQLNDEEKRLSLKNIEQLDKRRAQLLYLLKYTDLMLSEGIYFNYLNALEQKRNEKKGIVEEMTQIDINVGATRYQIEHGVEEIETQDIKIEDIE